MTSIAQTLRRDHERLEALFSELANAVEGADAPTIQQIWGHFEQGLMAHLEVEEQRLFPVVETHHPEEVARIRAEHDSIRRLVQDLGIRADIHTLRKQVADQLIATLREHAEREEQTLYRWADAMGGTDLLRAVIGFIKANR